MLAALPNLSQEVELTVTEELEYSLKRSHSVEKAVETFGHGRKEEKEGTEDLESRTGGKALVETKEEDEGNEQRKHNEGEDGHGMPLPQPLRRRLRCCQASASSTLA
ncbi:hypothetical protein BHM03_00050017, partial [Ensete ventricosum]